MGLRAARLGGGEPTPADGVTTKAAAREDDDFADFALQESTGEALSVDLEVGARHRVRLGDTDPLFHDLS